MKVGLICDRNFHYHTLFDSFRYAITSLYPGIKDVYLQDDLKGLDLLILPHPNHGPNLEICAAPGFIEKCNELGITVVIFFSEKIGRGKYANEIRYIKGEHDTFIKRFEDINPVLFKEVYSDEDQKYRLFNYLRGIKKCFIYAYDVDDCKEFGLKLFRVALSRKYERFGEYVPFSTRYKAIAFCGNHYMERRSIIKAIGKTFPCHIHRSVFPNWESYMMFLGKRQLILSPLGNANAFVSRFYEALSLKSIVVQQVKANTLQYYNKETQFKNCIFFERPEELTTLLPSYEIPKERGELWLEDVLKDLLKSDNLL